MTIRLLEVVRIGGVPVAAGQTVTLPFDQESALVARQKAEWVGSALSRGWMNVPSIFRIRLTGTGQIILDARNSLGEETIAVASYDVTSATNQIEFPYLGDDAVEMRVTLTGSAQLEVL